MDSIRNFLESSTIHGLAYIATGRNYVKLFWFLVVIAGFTGAGVLIYSSFQSWAESPVKTTIETLPITEITFPKVTVCPPKNTYTDLNYDLMMAENMTLDNDTRQELTNVAVELLYDHLHDTLLKNMRKLKDNDQYYNWYHGYNWIMIPYYKSGRVHYYVSTRTSSGSISTQYFGDKFDAAKVETDLTYTVNVYAPPNVTLNLDVEKVSLTDLSSGYDDLLVAGTRVDTTHRTFNYTRTGRHFYEINLERDVILMDVKKQKLDLMPGFRLTWHYSVKELEPEVSTDPSAIAFIRHYSNNIPVSIPRQILLFQYFSINHDHQITKLFFSLYKY